MAGSQNDSMSTLSPRTLDAAEELSARPSLTVVMRSKARKFCVECALSYSGDVMGRVSDATKAAEPEQAEWFMIQTKGPRNPSVSQTQFCHQAPNEASPQHILAR